MIRMYATLIINHDYTGVKITDFPKEQQKEIEKVLKSRGYDKNGNSIGGDLV